MDIDEIVVPLKHDNWSHLISNFTSTFRRNATSLSARNVFKFPSSKDTRGLFGRKRRAIKIQENGVSGKSFIRLDILSEFENNILKFSTSTAATVFNHFALHRLHGDVVRTAYFPQELALKLHYKTECPVDYKNECAQLKASTIEDYSLDRWKADIKRRLRKYSSLIEN